MPNRFRASEINSEIEKARGLCPKKLKKENKSVLKRRLTQER
jgi:hypothetical protein